MTRTLTSIALLLPLTLTGCGAVQQAAHDVAAEEIAVDLIGQSVWTGSGTWTFAGLEEFESMKIVSVNGGEDETRFVSIWTLSICTRARNTRCVPASSTGSSAAATTGCWAQ